jgi:hypothetical protein
MSTYIFDDEFEDDDPTDELPVLKDVTVGEEIDTTSMPGPQADADHTGQLKNKKRRKARQTTDARDSDAASLRKDLDARNERLAALETEFARLQAKTSSRLAEIEAAVKRLESQIGPRLDEPKEISSAEPGKLVCLTAEEPTEYPLDKPTVTIGRGATCDIQIGTHYVSREHARVIATASGYLIENLGSRNGVFVNAVKVESQELAANDLITIGDTQFYYQAGGNG